MPLAPRHLPRSPVKVIIRLVTTLYFSPLSTPSSRRCHPTFGVNALNPGNRAEHTLPGMPSRSHQQPRNGPSIRRVRPSRDFPSHFAPVFMFPRRTRVVPSQQLSLLVPKHGVRRLQGPARFSVRSNLANVDLRSHGVRLQQNFLSSGSLHRIRYIWTGRRLRARQSGEGDGYRGNG